MACTTAKIEIYRSGQSRRLHTGPSNDGDLSDYRIETLAEDEPLDDSAALTGIVVGDK